MRRDLFSEDHRQFGELVRRFLGSLVVPYFGEWERAGIVPRELYREAGKLEIVGVQVPEQYGGGGMGDTFRFNTAMLEEMGRLQTTLTGLVLHMNVVMPYFLHYATTDQKARWLPGMAMGELMTAIAMTEPGTGSDLAGIRTRAARRGSDYVLSGAKTFITGGHNAGLVVVVARTAESDVRHGGLSLLVVEEAMRGFSRGRNLEKLGVKAADTAELFFDEVRVPRDNLLGDEGAAFGYLTSNLAQERLNIAIQSVASARAAIMASCDYVSNRRAFGQKISEFQNTKFTLAECSTELEVAQLVVDRGVDDLDAGLLSLADAARIKLFCTEMQGRVIDKCLQLYGGYGYMLEYPIAKQYADARVTRIYGGTSEVMKSIIAKSMGL